MIKIPWDEWKEIKILKDSGLTYQKIADMYGVSRQAIHDGLKRKFKSYRKNIDVIQGG